MFLKDCFLAARSGPAGTAIRKTRVFALKGASDTPGRRYERLQRLISIPINLAKERQCSLALFQRQA